MKTKSIAETIVNRYKYIFLIRLACEFKTYLKPIRSEYFVNYVFTDGSFLTIENGNIEILN